MGTEVLDDPDVGDTRGEGPLATGRDLVHLAELARLRAAAKLLERGVEALDVPDGADQAGLRERLGDLPAGLARRGDGLLDERVDAGRGEGERDVLVEDGGDRDDRHLDPGGDQRLDVGQDVEVTRHAVGVAARVGDSHEVDAVDLAEHPGVVPTHGTEADEACAEVGHHAPAFTTVLTAVTMRSRSAWVSDGCTGREITCCAAISVSGRSRPGAKCRRLSRRWLGIG